MKKLLTALLLMALLAALACVPVQAASSMHYLGKPLKDFSVETIDGDIFTLSEALKDHDMVLINLWATWCGPCGMEFPYMEEAYAQYSDRVAIIALSVEPTDSPDVLRAYVEEHGMTFPVGSDLETNLAATFVTQGIPTSVVVDRFGNVALVEIGAQTSTGRFTALFDYFLSDDYTETTVLDGFPSPKPTAGAAEAALSAAANAAGGALVFRNAGDSDTWPMLPTEDGGRAALMSGNAGIDSSTAAVYTAVTADEGDVLAFDFRTSLQPAYDTLFVEVDGQTVKSFTGIHDWTSWAIPLAAGEHGIAFGCRKDADTDEGEDRVWISNVRVLSGNDARSLMASLPPQPVGDAFSVALNDADATPIEFDDPSGMLTYYFGTDGGWIVSGEATLGVTLTASDDPETAIVSDMNGLRSLSEMAKPDGSGYALTVPIEQDTYNAVIVQPGTEPVAQPQVFLLFDGEAGAEAFEEYLAMYGIDVAWRYGERPTAEPASAYTVTVVDQYGDPVPGAMVNFCTDSACTPAQSDESGVIIFDGEPYAYHLQILKLPEGYSFDPDFEAYTEPEYAAMTIQVVRD